ncbi:MAG: Lrp/AsnC family transcriptional regulator [Promethearchaeota archaeon]
MTKKEIDELDIQILKYLQEDARRSLKKLADRLKKKTSTIYHRLQRLKSNDFILGYSIIINPDLLNITKIGMHKIVMKPLNISSLDDMFLESFANFIQTEFPEVLFIALSEDSKVIYLISIHSTDEALSKFLETLKANPYIADVDSEYLSKIIKGEKLFSFNESWINTKKRKHQKKSTDNLDDEEEPRQTFEIDLDEDDDDIDEDVIDF